MSMIISVVLFVLIVSHGHWHDYSVHTKTYWLLLDWLCSVVNSLNSSALNVPLKQCDAAVRAMRGRARNSAFLQFTISARVNGLQFSYHILRCNRIIRRNGRGETKEFQRGDLPFARYRW